MTDLSVLKKQLEFYFSDSNFRTDKFLQLESKKNDGWINASVLLRFNRIATIGATLEQIKEVLSEVSLVEIKDIDIDENMVKEGDNNEEPKDPSNQNNNETVQITESPAVKGDFLLRKKETDEFKNYISDPELEQKVIVIRGFSAENKLEEIEKFLKKYFDFSLIRMKRDKLKNFIGSIFVEMKSVEDVEKALTLKIENTIGKNDNNEEKLEDESIKRQKLDIDVKDEAIVKNEIVEAEKMKNTAIPNYLTIQRKNDYVLELKQTYANLKESKKKAEEETEKKFLCDKFRGKFYKYECEVNEIDKIKDVVKDVAYVDDTNFVLRFREIQPFEEFNFEGEEFNVKVKKLNDIEIDEYQTKIPTKSKVGVKQKNRGGKRRNKNERF